MKLTKRGEKTLIAFAFAVAIGLGLFFPWDAMPWNQYTPHPNSPNGCWYDNSRSLGNECAAPSTVEKYQP
jgi:hypothetical protein